MQFKKYFSAFTLALTASFISAGAFAFAWSENTHDVLQADINGDGYQDLLLRAKRTSTSVSIPYSIEIEVALVPEGISDIILYGQDDGSFVPDYNPLPGLVGDVQWNPGGWDALSEQPVYDDFDGDGQSDILIESVGQIGASVVLLSTQGSNVSEMKQTSQSTSIAPEPIPLRGSPVISNPNQNVLSGGNYVGRVAGQLDITASGKPNYTLPISLLPAVGGLSPSLSLAYNGTSGNAELGSGWSLNGASVISRCPTLLDRDNYIDGVNFNQSDRFCLNGQPLIAVSGAYGANGTEYRVENEVFSKIVSYGTSGSGPAYFEVRRKGGEIESYGASLNSRLERQADSSVHSWFISELKDRENNAIEFEYSDYKRQGAFAGCVASSLGEHLLCRISYEPNATVSLEYEARNDVLVNNSEGLTRTTSKRLKNINVQLSSDLVRRYSLGYEYGSESGVSRLVKIDHCLADNNCLKPLIMSWEDGPSQVSYSLADSSSVVEGGPYNNPQYHLADVNADGRSDLIFTYFTDSDDLGRILYLSNSSGTNFIKVSDDVDTDYKPSLVSLNSQQQSQQQFLTGDFNGDGKSDLLWVGRQNSEVIRTLYLANANGDGFVSQGYQSDVNGEYSNANGSRYIPADVNGDGRTDLVWIYYYDTNLRITVYHSISDASGQVGLAKVSSKQDTDLSPDFYEDQNFAPGDVNGDGKTDIVWSFTYNGDLFRVVYLADQNGAGFNRLSLEQESGLPNFIGSKDIKSLLGDVNGDNRSDLVVTYRSGLNYYKRLYLATSGGTDFDFKSAQTSQPTGLDSSLFGTSDVYLNDINSDGRADLLYTYTYGGQFAWSSYLADSQGGTFVEGDNGSVSGASTSTKHQQYLLGDISADAKPDIVWATVELDNSLKRTTFLLPQTYPDHISSITDGFDNQTTIDYQYLTDTTNGSIYTRGTGSQYPIRDDNGLSYVVSQVQQSDGVGGLRTFNYQYEAARTHLRGRGFLGFATRTVTDQAKGLVTTETYRQDYPFNGMTASILVQDTAGNDIEKSYNHWKSYTYGVAPAQRNFVYLKDSAAIKYNPGTTAPLFAGITVNTFEQTYGNLTQEVKVVGSNISAGIDAAYDPLGTYSAAQISGREQTQTSDYSHSNNATDWRVGFLTSQSITVSKPSETDRTVTNTYSPWSSTSFLKASETMFEGSAIEQTITYSSRDSYGNPTSIETVGLDYDGSSTAARVTTFGSYIDGLYPQWRSNTLNHQTDLEYDPVVGKITQSADPNGLTVDTLYDNFGRNVYSKLADGTDITTTYQYCASSCPAGAQYYTLTQVTRNGVQGKPDSIEYYDAFDRVIQSRTQDFNGSWVLTDTEYDNLGRVHRRSVPYYSGEAPTYTEFEYDIINRVTREDKPNGGWVESTFTPGGAGVITHTVVDHIVDPINGSRSTSTIKHLNAQNLVVRAVDDANTPTDFKYDAWDNLRWVQVNNDPDTAISISFNDAGMKTLLNDPDAGTIQYQYDAFGNTRRETHNPGANQEVITSTYDVLNRLSTRTDTVGGISSLSGQWNYDTSINGIGLVASMSGPDVQEDYYYDGLSRLQEKRTTLLGGVPRSFHYRYDALSRLDVVAYPGGLTLQNAYNSTGFLDSVTNTLDSVVVWNAASGDKWGNVTEYTLGNGLTTQKVYNPDTGLISSIQTGANVQNNSYIFDSSGNLVRRNFNVGTSLVESFTYDGLNRLRSAATTGLSGGARALNYDYDALGNITFKTDVSDPNGYHYDKTNNAGPHAVTRTVLAGTTTNYGYDTKGNMVANGSKTLGYSIFNKPTSIVNPANNSSIDFKYGPDRRRFYQRKVQSGGVTETLYYDSGNYEIVKEGNQLRQKAYVGDYLVYQSLLAGTDINQPAVDVGKKYTYLHRDNLGSTDAVTDGTGAVVTRNLFDPFGLRRKTDGANATPAYLSTLASTTFDTTSRGYTGHEQLDAVGLIHMNGRIYDPTLGRFLSPDQYVQYPYFSQSYNRYTYVLNNPLSYNDPDGEIIPILVWGAVAAWRAYSAYDTVTTAIENYETITDPNASNLDKGLAILDTGSSIVVPKFVREIGKKAGSGVKAAADKLGDTFGKLKPKVDAPNGPKPNANQADNALTSKTGSGGCNCCFIGSTLVLTKDGYKAIDQLQLGDLVASKNEETGEVDWKPVTETFIFDDDRITWQLTLKGQDSIQEFEVTDNHPFWVLGAGWVEVQDLAAGMKVTTFADTEMEVVEVTPLERSPITYNIEVADFHTFYVGEEKVWVHNSCGCDIFENKLPESLENELQDAKDLGVKPVGVDSPEFESVANAGTVKWAVKTDGELVVIPKHVDGKELKHPVLSGGEGVKAAGEAEIAVSGAAKQGISINRKSGHFEPSEESLETGVKAFKEKGVEFLDVDTGID